VTARLGWIAAAALLLVLGPPDEQRFPHARHAGLFPTCMGCHTTALTDSLAGYPSPLQCAGCHDGQQQPRVAWNGPAPHPTNLRFSHVRHRGDAQLGDAPASCRECHAVAGDSVFMAVQRAMPQPCIGCHGHPASAHLANDAPCRTCHVPLVQAATLPDSTIAGFPRPPSHDAPDFLVNHGPSVAEAQARCAVCHTRELCATCHLDAERQPAIQALGSDARVARLVAARPARYPEPPSHQRADWPWAHGGEARARTQSCATCHARPSCTSCHIGSLGADVIRQLPEGPGGVQLRGREPAWPPAAPSASSGGSAALSGGAAGVVGRVAVLQVSLPTRAPLDTNPPIVSDTAPRRVRVHPTGFARSHDAAAASRGATCSGCHERAFCSDCHDGEAAGQRRFHPPNFVERHPSDAYRRQQECSTCHNPEAFCKACHQSVGLKSQGRLGVAFHSAQPLWLLQHGRAARQGMESCTSCHVQRDCMRCHSTTGWGVNPHGPGFDAARMQKRNPQTCRYCHVGDPLGRP
jgi:hypothetical protein